MMLMILLKLIIYFGLTFVYFCLSALLGCMCVETICALGLNFISFAAIFSLLLSTHVFLIVTYAAAAAASRQLSLL